MDGRHRSRHERGRRANDTDDGTEFRADETARRKRYGVRGDSAIHARESKQFDWLDRRSQRWRTLRHVGRLQLSQNKAGRRTFADRSANRSKRAALRTTNAMESARFARAPRR